MQSAKKDKLTIIIAGLIIGVIAAGLVYFGNPKNMGFCIACFLRDTSGALGLHRAVPVQYIRPEIIGIVLGSLICAFAKKEFSPRGGSAPMTRFVLAICVMIGCLMFLGCPFRMVLRLAGGDLNALVGFVGFVVGILVGVVFLKKGFSLKRTYKLGKAEGLVLPVIEVVIFALLCAAPAFIFFTPATLEDGTPGGPGALHASVWISLFAGLVVGALAQRTRLCMVGGVRDLVLFKEKRLILGFVAIFVAALVMNYILGSVTGTSFVNWSFDAQPIAYNDGLWNFLGLFLVGFGCCLLGGCPLRQLVMSGEGNTDSAVVVVGLMVGAAFCHNFGLASSGEGPTDYGKIAVILAIIVVAIIGCVNTFGKKAE